MAATIRFDLKSFLVFLLLFVIEVLIALLVKDSIIRPYGGDVLVVIMIYYFCKIFINAPPLYLCIGVLIFAFSIEIGQYFRLVEVLNLQDNPVARTVIGSSFSWGDLLAYTLGIVICYLIEKRQTKQEST